jgi:hypothetical protein
MIDWHSYCQFINKISKEVAFSRRKSNVHCRAGSIEKRCATGSVNLSEMSEFRHSSHLIINKCLEMPALQSLLKIRAEIRDAYMKALEDASVRQNIKPFCRFLSQLI